MEKFKFAVLISGNGTNLQALINKFASSCNWPKAIERKRMLLNFNERNLPAKLNIKRW